MEKHDLANLSHACDKSGNYIEPEFSVWPCDCCGNKLHGDRYIADGYSQKDKCVLEFNYICWNCIYYAEYKQLDDMTMLSIEDWDD